MSAGLLSRVQRSWFTGKPERLRSYRLIWPRELKESQVTSALRMLATTAGTPLVLDCLGLKSIAAVAGAAGSKTGTRTASPHVEHRLHLREAKAGSVITQLRSTIPGIGIEGTAFEPFKDNSGNNNAKSILNLNLRLSTQRRPLNTDDPESLSRSLLSALAGVRGNEAILLRWVLTDRLRPQATPSTIVSLPPESLLKMVLSAPFGTSPPADSETRTAIKNKRQEPGWRVIGKLAVTAATAARRQKLASSVLGALRQAEGPGVGLTARTVWPIHPGRHKLDSASGHGKLRLNTLELTSLIAWPISDSRGAQAQSLPVLRLGSRRLPPAKLIARSGRIIGSSTWPSVDNVTAPRDVATRSAGVQSKDHPTRQPDAPGHSDLSRPYQPSRPLAIAPDDSLRHLHLLGPTGTGKSTLLLNLALQDIQAGKGLVLIDPKSDLITDLLARIPKERWPDVVLLDPTSQEMVVGINPLVGSKSQNSGFDPTLAADQLLEIFHRLYAGHWGPRTNDILGSALQTLTRSAAQNPGISLSAVPLLLTNPSFRRRIVGQLNDPIGLQPFWASFEAWSEAERTSAIAPVLNKLRPFLMRPNLRRIVSAGNPKFSFGGIFADKPSLGRNRIVLVDLAKGRIGSEAAALLGSLVLSQLWQAIQSRSSVPQAGRRPVNIYLDEFQDYLHLPLNLAEALAQARGLGVGFTLAHQHLGQLTPSLKTAVLANARSRVCFQLGQDDARTMAKDNAVLSSQDFAELDSFHFYAQLMADGQAQPWCSGLTQPPTPATGNPDRLRAQAAQNYGTPAHEIDQTIVDLLTPASKDVDKAPRSTSGDAETKTKSKGKTQVKAEISDLAPRRISSQPDSERGQS